MDVLLTRDPEDVRHTLVLEAVDDEVRHQVRRIQASENPPGGRAPVARRQGPGSTGARSRWTVPTPQGFGAAK